MTRVDQPRDARITFTLDVEDHRMSPSQELRYPIFTRRVLDFLDGLGVKGTFFVVGEVAAQEPGLVREIADRGHEIAYHSQRHKPLTEETLETFRRETVYGKSNIEDITGKRVAGYRAPVWSLTRDTLWVVDALVEAEFDYSSSVMPAWSPLFGFAGAPRHPFRWPNGLLELPVPVVTVSRSSIPVLGGIYLRYLPRPLFAPIVRGMKSKTALWTYCHPYDFDTGQRFMRTPRLGYAMSLALWMNRRGTFGKMARLLALGTAPPLGARIEAGEFRDCAVTFDGSLAVPQNLR